MIREKRWTRGSSGSRRLRPIPAQGRGSQSSGGFGPEVLMAWIFRNVFPSGASAAIAEVLSTTGVRDLLGAWGMRTCGGLVVQLCRPHPRRSIDRTAHCQVEGDGRGLAGPNREVAGGENQGLGVWNHRLLKYKTPKPLGKVFGLMVDLTTRAVFR